LNQAQLNTIKIYVINNAIKKGGGRLQERDIKEYIQTNFNFTYQKTNIYHLLHELNLNWVRTGAMHPKQSTEIQEDFKKFQIKTILKIPGHIRLDNVNVWFQDEARFGQCNTTTRIWAKMHKTKSYSTIICLPFWRCLCEYRPNRGHCCSCQ